jgi:hypothetical protein
MRWWLQMVAATTLYLVGTAMLSGCGPRFIRGDPAPLEYRSWLSSPRVDRKTGDCTFTVFALVTREHLTGLRVDGVPLKPDWSWSWEAVVPQGHFGSGMMVEFVDLDTGEVVRTHEITALCPWRNEEVWQ